MSGREAGGDGILAWLGPTNTGKTHRAIEALLEYESGMIGLPLRLLAREVYDKLSVRVGEGAVALLTGEEKRIPRRPRYWVCTVESMPLELELDMVVVDEIQLCADPQRGHVFTDRLLHLRGRLSTWFLGASTMAELLPQLVPTAHIRHLTRLSRLEHAGRSSLGALRARSAVVAFSAPEVYELAERLRQRKGGAAVVLGALSPRARNAQVAMYQAGEVAHLVATDAIGMGLNMDVDHVAFASRRKYDGRSQRALAAHELAQIAGRAGRHQRDGSFGTLDPLPPLPEAIAAAIVDGRFDPLQHAVWRARELDFSSVDALARSLAARPRHPRLRLVTQADDSDALQALRRRPEVLARARTPAQVELLWSVCRIPDYRKLLLDDHPALLAELFLQLTGPRGRIDPDWMAGRLARLDHMSGELDALMTRMAWVRTWTYVSSHPRWIDDAEHWQGRARDLEDRLSDAIHELLTRRFVDRGTRRGWQPSPKGARASRRPAGTSPSSTVPIDPAHPFARLATVELGPSTEDAAEDPGAPPLASLVEAPHDRFWVAATGHLHCEAGVIARWTRGVDLLSPRTSLRLGDNVGPGLARQLSRRLDAWTRDAVRELLAPLRVDADGARRTKRALSAPLRGLLYALERGLGSIRSRGVRPQLRRLDRGDRALADRLGLRIGELLIFAPALLRPEAVIKRAALWRAYTDEDARELALPTGAEPSVPVPLEAPRDLFEQIGYPVFAGHALRADLAERAHRRLRAAGPEPAPIPAELADWLGCPQRDLPRIVEALGFRRQRGHAYVARR